MNAAATVLFSAAALIYLGTPAYLLGLMIRERLDMRAEDRRRVEQKRIADVEWFALLAVSGPSLSTHPAADRIRERIAANEAARVDAEWEAMNDASA